MKPERRKQLNERREIETRFNAQIAVEDAVICAANRRVEQILRDKRATLRLWKQESSRNG
jgi:hypothetical protein